MLSYTTRDHDFRGQARMIQLESMIEPGAEHGRGLAVVLRSSQHHDRVSWPPLVLSAGPPDRDESDEIERSDEENYGEKCTAADGEHGRNLDG